jgi:serine/threonine-protein kinase/endoribonuclease IRE1
MQLAFLQDFSDRVEGEDKETSPILKALERKAAKVLGGTDWYARLDPGLIETLGKYRNYDGSSVQDLMRVIRNKVSILCPSLV